MLFSISKFIISWACFILFRNKRKFSLLVPTCYIAVILALITDLLMFVYPLWKYESATKLQLFIKQMLNSFGIYFVVTYFFLQTLPKKQTPFTVGLHIFYWSVLCILIEVLALRLGYIKHSLWWNLGWSYLADWILFIIFFAHHKYRNHISQ